MRRFVGRANFPIETQNKMVHTLEMPINHMEELARLLMGSISMFGMSNSNKNFPSHLHFISMTIQKSK